MIQEYIEKLFENIKLIDEKGNEYWFARELITLLEYSKWERFSNAIENAKIDAKIKKDNVDNEYTANSVHYEVGKEVRESIKRLGGTMPEDLPTPKTSLKELEKDNKKLK